MELRGVQSSLRWPRVGLVVPKHRHSNVERNRLKRRLREVVRRHLLPTLPALDLTIRVSPDAYGAPFDALEADLLRARDTMMSRLRDV